MQLISKILTIIVALEHVYFLVLEMFLWQTPHGMKTFGTTPEFAAESQALAMNQGLYNGFLAAGLVWAVFFLRDKMQLQVQVFFLACVVVAGIFGGLTAKPTIFFVQGVPAILALITTYLAGRQS